MDWTQIAVTGITVLLTSGIIQFFVNRKDKQKDDAKKDHDEVLKQDMKDHLTNVNNKWKEDYCDKNAKAIADLAVEVKNGLEEREATGHRRYEEHRIAIKEMAVQHEKEFLELKKAIDKLTENDIKITDSISKMANKQEIMADSLVGQAHDRILFLTDKITERGAITNKEKATIDSMYEPYKRLGGNGYVSTSVQYVKALKTVSEEEAREMDINNKRKQQG